MARAVVGKLGLCLGPARQRGPAAAGEERRSPPCVGRAASEALDGCRIALEQSQQAARGPPCPKRFAYTFEERVESRFPVAGGAHHAEQAVLRAAMLFGVKRRMQ
jgi:hypothetical protein